MADLANAAPLRTKVDAAGKKDSATPGKSSGVGRSHPNALASSARWDAAQAQSQLGETRVAGHGEQL